MNDSVRQNTRGLKRHEITAPVDVVDASRGVKLGQLVNIHTEGLLVVGENKLLPDHVYQLDIQLPSPLLGAHSIRLGVDCLWVRTDGDSPLTWAGCHIIDLSDLARRQIETLVEEMGG